MELLRGVRVISFNHFLMGPAGVQALADLGADVIAVEPPDGAFQRRWGGADKRIDGQTTLFLCANRNKRSLALDLKSEAGRAVALRLIGTADVVAENFRPGVMDKLGLGWERLRELNPRLIYAAASGYGPDGPYAGRPGQDLLIQAMSGLAAITGTAAGGPRAVGVSAADHHGAALFAMGILAALVSRDRTGRGMRVDVSLLSAAIDLQVESFVTCFNGEPPESVAAPPHVAGWYFPAPYGIYATGDGQHLAISIGPLRALGEALDLPEIAALPDSEAFARRDEIAAAVAGAVARRTTAALEAEFARRGIWHARVNDYADVALDPQVRHNGTFATVPGATGTPVTFVTHPVRYDGRAPEVRLPPQPLGAQTDEVLRELGLAPEEIARLEAEGVVRRHRDGGGEAETGRP